jgi:hypothetical protein
MEEGGLHATLGSLRAMVKKLLTHAQTITHAGDSCAACGAGKHKAKLGSSVCEECEAGKFADSTASVECQDCAANADSDAGSEGCFCVAGYTGDGSSCSACNPGTYKSADGAEKCVDCAAGTYSASSASIACDACAANAQSSAGSPACICNAGFTGDGASCAACTAGKYKEAAGDAGCSDCAAGKYSASQASLGCQGTCCAQGSGLEDRLGLFIHICGYPHIVNIDLFWCTCSNV